MRKQYHFRSSGQGLLAWDVDRLVELSAGLTPINVPLFEIRELDEPFWFKGQSDAPTCRNVALHAKLMNDTGLQFPIILSRNGGVIKAWYQA